MAFLLLDESERGDFLVVGGFIVPTSGVSDLEAEWRKLKAGYGLPQTFPLKWSPDGESAKILKAKGLRIDDIRRDVCQWLGGRSDILALVMVLEERRRGMLRPGRGGVRDFYAAGVAFAVQRFAKVVAVDPGFAGPPHVVVLDSIAWSHGRRSPLLDNKATRFLAYHLWKSQKPRGRSIVPWMAEGHKALQDEYSCWLEHGFPQLGIPGLQQSGFLSSFFEAHGEGMGILQMADFVCGCAAELFSSVASGRSSPTAAGRVKDLMPAFCKDMGFGSAVWGWGIVLYPSNWPLWQKIQQLLGP